MKRTNIFCFVLGFIVWAYVADARVITTVVGTDWTFPPAPLPALNVPLGNTAAVAVDAAGSIYVGDPGNLTVFRISSDGSLTVVAGNGVSGYAGDDGPDTHASLSLPFGIAVDTAGGVYIADGFNSLVRRVAPNGVITTIAGNGISGFSGDGGPATIAQLDTPVGLAVDRAGNLYISENNRVRKVAPGGTITTVAGNGQSGYSGDGGPATGATLSLSTGLAVDGAGNLYIADTGNSAIRVVTPGGMMGTVPGTLIQGSGAN